MALAANEVEYQLNEYLSNDGGQEAPSSSSNSNSPHGGDDSDGQPIASTSSAATSTSSGPRSSTHHLVEWANDVAKSTYRPRYNVPPVAYSVVLRSSSSSSSKPAPTAPHYSLDLLKWGVIPSWSTEPPAKGPAGTTNATCEKLMEGGGLWGSLRDKKRCVVPMQGFYEWRKRGKDNLPHFIKPADGKLLLLAGLWDHADYKGTFDPVTSFTIITVPVSSQLAFIHHRMPAVLTTPEEVALWCSDEPWEPKLQKLVRTFESRLEVYQVDKGVGKVGNESPSFIEPIEKKKGGLMDLFARQEASPTKPSTSSPPTWSYSSAGPSSSAMKKSASASSSSGSTSSNKTKSKPKKVKRDRDSSVEILEEEPIDEELKKKKKKVEKEKEKEKGGKKKKQKLETNEDGVPTVTNFFKPVDT